MRYFNFKLENKYFSIIIYVVAFVYCLTRVLYFWNLPIGSGDESVFLADIKQLNDFGFFESVKKQVSIPHLLAVYPLTYFFKHYIALRVLNILFAAAFLAYIYRNFKFKENIILFFAVFNVPSFLIGTNDGMFHFFLLLFFLESLLFLLKRKNNLKLGLVFLVSAFFTREMIITYFLAFSLLILYIILFVKYDLKKDLIPAFSLALIFLLLNIPSIIENKGLSYDNKTGVGNNTWVERQYLSQLMVNDGKLKNYNHVTWNELTAYKKIHGEDSLPKSVIQQLTFNLLLTFKEFFKDFFYMLKDSLRQTGLIQIFVFVFLFLNLKRFKENILIIPLISLLTYFVFALITISYVEMRWLTTITILSVVYYQYVIGSECFPYSFRETIHKFNIIAVFLLMIYGIVKIIPKLFILS